MSGRRAAVVVCLALVSLAGCSSSPTPLALVSGVHSVDDLRGDVLTPPTKEPRIVLTDTSGTPYNVVARDGAKVTLIYFGYTHCPDICPTFMADTAEALRESPPAVRRDVTVVFITVDPHRDRLPVVRRWLDHFSRSFVGLRGSIRQVIAIQKAADVPVSKVDPHAKEGYSVQHSAELLAFTPDHEAHVVYTDGPTTISDLKHDLAVLVTDRNFAG